MDWHSFSVCQHSPWKEHDRKGKYVNIYTNDNIDNIIAQVPHEVADYLDKEDPSIFTFHSFRRSSASIAADMGGTALQMQSFFGWKNSNMAMEYISTSKTAIEDMANKLAHSDSDASGPSMAPPSSPSVDPPSGPTVAPSSGPSMASPSGSFVAPPSGPSVAPPSGPFVTPPSGLFVAPPSGPSVAFPTGLNKTVPPHTGSNHHIDTTFYYEYCSGTYYPVFSPTGDAVRNNGKVYIIQGGQFFGNFS